MSLIVILLGVAIAGILLGVVMLPRLVRDSAADVAEAAANRVAGLMPGVMAQVERERQMYERFAAEREQLDAEYAALPAPVKEVIDRRRALDPNYRIHRESADLFIFTEAEKFAAAARVADESSQREADAFWSSLEDEQVASDPFIAKDDLAPLNEVMAAGERNAAVRWMYWAWCYSDSERSRQLLGASANHSRDTLAAASYVAMKQLAGLPLIGPGSEPPPRRRRTVRQWLR